MDCILKLEKEIHDVIHNQVKENYMRKADAEEIIKNIRESKLIYEIFSDWNIHITVIRTYFKGIINNCILHGDYDTAEQLYLFDLESYLRVYKDELRYFQWHTIIADFLKRTIKEGD